MDKSLVKQIVFWNRAAAILLVMGNGKAWDYAHTRRQKAIDAFIKHSRTVIRH